MENRVEIKIERDMETGYERVLQAAKDFKSSYHLNAEPWDPAPRVWGLTVKP